MDYKQFVPELPKKNRKDEPAKDAEGGSAQSGEDRQEEGDPKKRRSYYYDDAYGYEDYEPEDEPGEGSGRPV